MKTNGESRTRFILIWMIVVFSGTALLFIFWSPWIAYEKARVKLYYSEAQNWQRVFCYDTLVRGLNYAFYGDDVEDGALIVEFYKQKNLNENIPISFEIQAMPFERAVYVKEFVENSDLVKVVSFDTTCWGFIEGYVSRQTISQIPPSKQLLLRHEEFIRNYNESEEGKTRRLTQKRGNCISDYGVQCDCK